MSKLLNALITVLFVLFLAVPTMWGLIMSTHSNSWIEKQRLAAIPKNPINWQEVKKYPAAFDNYYADHFGFRWSLLSPYRHLKYFVGDSPLETSFFGADKGWIFYKSLEDGDVLGDYRNINRFSDKQLAKFIKHIKQKQSWLANQGIEYLFVLAPSKHYIYPEKMPSYIRQAHQQNLVIQLSQALDKHPEINYINLRPELLKSKNNQLLYYKSDTHWNYYGTNIAQYAIAKKLSGLFGGLIQPYLLNESEFTEKTMVSGDLAQYMGLGHYFMEEKVSPKFDECSKFDAEKSRLFTTNCPDAKLKALVFRDSFFTSLQPYMSKYFKESTYIWEKMTFSRAKEYIQKSKPDIVIEEWVDRFLPSSLAPEYKY